ncbi:hypothetical protein [Candidatus Lokiarchaeum ossiferum]
MESNNNNILPSSVGKSSSTSCMICHMPIELTNFGMGENILEQNYVGCPNAHLVHRECLKRWIIHSQNCPVCHEKYDIKIIQIFEEYVAQKEADKERSKQQKQDSQRKTLDQPEQIDPEFEEKFNRAENLAKQQNFEAAMNIYWDILEQNKYPKDDGKTLRVVLHLGLAYYKMGKYAQCIRQLMKIIKIDYNYPLVFYFLGLTYEQLEMADKTKWAMERAKINAEKLSSKNDKYTKYLADIKKRLK